MALFRDAASRRRELIERCGLVAVSTGALVSTRSISLLWVLVAVMAALVLGDRSVIRSLLGRPIVWATAFGAAVMGGVTVAWYLNPPDLPPIPFAGAGATFGEGLTEMIFRTFEYTSGYIGYFGWLDTEPAPLTIIVCSLLVGVVLVYALAVARPRGRSAVLLIGAVLLVTPPITQAILIGQLGYIWQGRYMLAVFLALVVVAGVAISDTEPAITPSVVARRCLALGLSLLAAGQVASFFWALRRYVVGTDFGVVRMLFAATWQPPLGWETLTVLFAIVCAGCSVVIYRYVNLTWSEKTSGPAVCDSVVASDGSGVRRRAR